MTLFPEEENQVPPKREPVSCVFCAIIRGDVRSYQVFRDDISMAILDKRPVFPGHCLLVPLAHYGTLADLPEEIIGPFFSNAKLVAMAVEVALQADGSFVAINNKVSQSVPHLHIHIVPRRVKDGLRGFFWPRQNYTNENAALDVQNAIQKEISNLKQR